MPRFYSVSLGIIRHPKAFLICLGLPRFSEGRSEYQPNQNRAVQQEAILLLTARKMEDGPQS
jgi:hypothetical protein